MFWEKRKFLRLIKQDLKEEFKRLLSRKGAKAQSKEGERKRKKYYEIHEGHEKKI